MIKILKLAVKPTPLQRLNRLSERWSGDIWIKRDDLTGSGLTGNKVRKLEYLLADAMDKDADTIITCGGVQSNHCRAAALSAAKVGLKSILLLRGDRPHDLDGNLLLDHLAGADLRFISTEKYRGDLPGELNRLASEVNRTGGKAYIIPEGGSNSVGSWGYAEALREAYRQCHELRIVPRRIICATGSGGTHAGLLVGTLLENWDVEIVSITVSYDLEETTQIILSIIDSMIDLHKLNIRVSKGDIRVIDGYIGEGYAKAGAEVLDVISEVARYEGIITDPVYTGKGMTALKSELAKGEMDGTTLFWHTGGVFGLFPFKDQFLRSQRDKGANSISTC